MKKQALNPYLPGWEYIPDGEPRLFDGRVYIYGSHDEANGTCYSPGDYVCWSASEDDLASWCFEGIIFRKEDDPENTDGKQRLYAPDVVCGPDGRYYLYYFLDNSKRLSVAVCDTPAGHYQYYGDIIFPDGERLSIDSGFGAPFDPAVLCESGGIWLYYGYGMQKRVPGAPEGIYNGCYAVRLASDMRTMCTLPVNVIPGTLYAPGTGYADHGFLEAASIRHYGDLYYLIYSSEHGHELCYATSRFPDREFCFRGTVISHGDVGLNGRTEEAAAYYLGNNHGGLIRIKGNTYIFYHRHTCGAQYSRQGCAEPVSIEADGEIKQVEITSCGLNQGPLRAKGEYSAHIACFLQSSQGALHYSSSVHWNELHPYITQEAEGKSASEQNPYIFNLRDGACCGFKYLQFDGDEREIRLRLRGRDGGRLKVRLDSPNGTVISEIPVRASGHWGWVSGRLTPVTGRHALYFSIEQAGPLDLDAFAIYGKDCCNEPE